MRRRERDTADGIPERLLRFVAAEWPGAGVTEAFRAWKDARYAFAREFPGSALGDRVDVLARHVRERRNLTDTMRG